MAPVGLAGAARADVITDFHNDISGPPVAATDENGRLLWKESYRPYGERLLNPVDSTHLASKNRRPHLTG